MKTLILITLAAALVSCGSTSNQEPGEPEVERERLPVRAARRAGDWYCGEERVDPRQLARKLFKIGGVDVENVCEVMADDSI